MPLPAAVGPVFDSSASPMAVLSLDGRFVRANAAYLELVGRDHAELIGQSCVGLTEAADVRAGLEAVESIAHGEATARVRKRYVRPDGHVTWVDALLSALVDDTGRVSGVLCHAHPTDGSSPERVTLTESEARFRAALENAPIGMAVLGLDGEWLQVNRVLCATLGRTAADLSRHGLRLEDVVLAADLQRLLPLGDALVRGRSDWARGTCRLHRQHGTPVWCDVTLTLIRGSGGEPLHLLLHVVELGGTRAGSPEFGELHHLTELATASDEIVYYRLQLDPELLFEHVSESALVMSGYAPEDFYGDPRLLFDLIHPDDAPQLLSLLAEPERAARELVFRWRHRDGREVTTRSRHTPVRRDGAVVALEGVLVDITRQRDAERDRATSEARFRSLVQHSIDVLLLTDPEGRITYATPSAVRIFGSAPDADAGTSIWDHVHPDDVAKLRRAYRQPSRRIDLRLGASTNGWRWQQAVVSDLRHDPAVRGIVINARDVHDQRVAEEALRANAVTDPLTGLPNRALLQDRIERALLRNRSTSSAVAVVTLDLDRFEAINDALGYAAADLVLVEVGARLAAAAPDAHTVGRFAGDRFVVCGEGFESADEVRRYGELLREAAVGTVDVEGTTVPVEVSAGVAIADGPDVTAAELVRRAASATRRAKDGGGGALAFYDPSSSGRAMVRARFEQALQGASAGEQLVAHYQPIVDLDSGLPVAAEALVRWQHPTDGLLQPGDFISIAEETGAIVDIGAWILDDACRQLRRWRALDGMEAFTVAVNLAARQLADRRTVDALVDALRRHDLPTSALTVEVTESAALGHGHLEVLDEIHRLGIPIALDDFGTHYSSLSYLQRLPVQHLKIDRSFVTGISADRQRRAIVMATAQLGRALRLTTVAEGVEDDREAFELQLLGIDRGQGYHFGRPMPASELGELLESRRRPSS